MKNSIILNSIVVVIAAFVGTILGNFPSYFHPSIDSHSELYAAILGALIGSTVGGAISFSLSFHEAKMKLTLEKTKLYEQLKFATTDVIACFQGAIENPENWNDPKYKDDGLKEMHKWLNTTTAAQDACSDLTSPEMGLISHFLTNSFSETFRDFLNTPLLLPKIQNSLPKLDKALGKMIELSALECNLSRSVLNSNFFEYCIFLITPNKKLSEWKKNNKTYLDALSIESQRLVPNPNFI